MIAAIYNEQGRPLVLRGDPSINSVKRFVQEHARRYEAGLPGGPSGLPARKITSAFFFESEEDLADLSNGKEIDISKELV